MSRLGNEARAFREMPDALYADVMNGRTTAEEAISAQIAAPLPGFRDTLQAYLDGSHPTSGAKWRYDAAMSLPQLPGRADDIAMADGVVRAAYAANMWREGIENAAARLRSALAWSTQTDDPIARLAALPEVEDSAALLLHLLGEGEAPE